MIPKDQLKTIRRIFLCSVVDKLGQGSRIRHRLASEVVLKTVQAALHDLVDLVDGVAREIVLPLFAAAGIDQDVDLIVKRSSCHLLDIGGAHAVLGLKVSAAHIDQYRSRIAAVSLKLCELGSGIPGNGGIQLAVIVGQTAAVERIVIVERIGISGRLRIGIIDGDLRGGFRRCFGASAVTAVKRLEQAVQTRPAGTTAAAGGSSAAVIITKAAEAETGIAAGLAGRRGTAARRRRRRCRRLRRLRSVSRFVAACQAAHERAESSAKKHEKKKDRNNSYRAAAKAAAPSDGTSRSSCSGSSGS